MDRRKFIAAGVGAGAALMAWKDSAGRPPARPVVAVVRASAASGQAEMTRKVYRRLLEAALCDAAGASSGSAAVSLLASASDTVGFKLNLLAGPPMSPSVELSAALASIFASAGFPRGRLLFWERHESELSRCGYRSGDFGGSVIATDSPGQGYEDEPLVQGSIGSCFSRILTRRIDALVSVGVVKDHDLAGVSGAVKNLYGCIHNPNKYHDGNCDPYLTDLLSAPPVREKLRLSVLDAAWIQHDGGPLHRPGACSFFGGVMAGTDAVAVDAVARMMIEKARKERGLKSLKEAGRDPKWLESAGRLGLGASDPSKIKIVEKVV
jgi:hypothetical protein